jgi:FdhE protein
MSAPRLRRLLGRSAPDADVEAALADLARLAQDRPALARPARLLRDILPGLFEEPIRESAPALSREGAAAKLADGIPLLRGEALEMDISSFGRRWTRACTALQRYEPGAAELAAALRSGALEPGQLLQDVLAGVPEAVHAQASACGVDPGLAANVLRLTLFPMLCHVSADLAVLRQQSAWDKGFCPTCGSWPLLGEFRGLEQTCLLRCGLCTTEWPFGRLRCPFCETADHRQLSYFHLAAEEAKYRVSLCSDCRGYIKMVSTFGALTPPALLAADVATLHLDLAASERGLAPARDGRGAS